MKAMKTSNNLDLFGITTDDDSELEQARRLHRELQEAQAERRRLMREMGVDEIAPVLVKKPPRESGDEAP